MRASGILMPVFSLPGPFGIGTLGKEAFAFVDFLADAKQTYWQILPIGPTGYGDSPYQSFSAFAGNPYFIDYRLLAADDLLTADEIPAERPIGPIDYGALYNERPVVLKKAADRLLASPSPAYEAFCREHSFWLEDYALFMAVKATQGQAGLADWPNALRCREPEAIAAANGIDMQRVDAVSGKGCAVKPSARYSPLQDLDAGRHTEIDMFSGTLIRMGKKLGILTPYNEFAYHMIKALEEKNDGKFDYTGPNQEMTWAK